MKYAVLIYGAPEQFDGMSEDEQRAVYNEYVELTTAPGVSSSVQLQPTATAVTLRDEGGQLLTTDGPFPEMKEYFAGFYLLDAHSRDEAVEFASRLPAARMGGAVEVRPVAES
jgi:hypothetical protein